MIVFRQREFSWLNTPNDLGPDNSLVVPKLVIKSFEMAKLNDGIHLNHWIEGKICNDNFKYCIKKKIPLQLPIVFTTGDDFLQLIDESVLPEKTIKSNMVRFKNSDEFLTYAKKEVASERLKGEIKYPAIPINKMLPNTIYQLIFRALALTLSGQIDEYIYNDLWKNSYYIENEKIDYKEFNPISPNQIGNLFSSLLIQVLGFTNTGINDLTKLKINWN